MLRFTGVTEVTSASFAEGISHETRKSDPFPPAIQEAGRGFMRTYDFGYRD